jgi:hypothetical protein
MDENHATRMIAGLDTELSLPSARDEPLHSLKRRRAMSPSGFIPSQI